ncbi:hypothetical protein MMC17_008067 [Xylographa soralifera]|nr:hypothetical protein [Xylographa soralifera]
MRDNSHSAIDALESYKARVLRGFHQETQKFEAALRDVLVPLDTTSSQDHVALRIELNALRSYPEKVRKLEQDNAELRSKLERAAKRTGQPSAKSRSATPNTVVQNKPRQVEPSVQQEINVVHSTTVLGEPVLGPAETGDASSWLYTHVEADAESKIAEVALWNAYALHSKSVSSTQAPLLSNKDFTSLVVRVFADARVLYVSDSVRKSYIIGIKFRHACMDIQRLEGLVKEKDRDYAILVEKHFKLLDKSHELKESLKSWQAYYDRFVPVPHLKRHSVDNVTFVGIDDDQSRGNASPVINTETLDYSVIQQNLKEHGATSITSTPRTDFPSKDHSGHLVGPVGPTASSDLDEELLLPQLNACVTANHSYASDACASDNSTQLASSPTTDNKKAIAGIVPAVAVVVEDDSDSPIVVSERSLKRKRQKSVQHGIFHVHEDTCRQVESSGKPILVKSEPGSSPVAPTNTHVGDSVHDTLDLDEVGDGGLTPMKRKRLRKLFGSKKANNDTIRKPSSLTCTGDTENGHADPNIITEDLGFLQYQEDDNNVRASFKRLGDEYGQRLLQQHLERKAESMKERENVDFHISTQLQAPLQTRMAKQHLHNQKVNSRQNQSLTKTRNGTTRSEVKAASSTKDQAPGISYRETKDILQPITPNIQILPRTSIQACISKASPIQKRCSKSSAQILMLSEDGDCGSRCRSDVNSTAKQSVGSVAGSSSKVSTMTAIHHRLDGLLSEPSPEKPTLTRSDEITRPARVVDDTLKSFHESFRTGNTRSHGPIIALEEAASLIQTTDLEAEKPREILSSSRPRPMTYTGTSQGPTRKERPLRTRPIHSLRLDDFKLNPAANYGVDFAFNQVIRNKYQRRCLPNCTKPECCGDKFHKIVRIGGIPAPQTRGLWDSSQTDDAEQDYRLLQDFTSLNTETLESMSTAEKSLLLERAKAQKFGSEYGRHRHVHERAASPPGFWRTEMPTTQEVEGDKEKALIVEREKIEGRYQEAMKGSGKWVFRDE